VHIAGGKIARVGEWDDAWQSIELIDVGESVVMPGNVDAHVHVNEPGRTEWEGYATATKAAAAGGVTTTVDMPLNSIPPTTTLVGFEENLPRPGGSTVDVAFWGGVVPGIRMSLGVIERRAFFKCFLIHPALTNFRMSPNQISALRCLRSPGSVPSLVHAEVPARSMRLPRHSRAAIRGRTTRS
jgi:allantoinase